MFLEICWMLVGSNEGPAGYEAAACQRGTRSAGTQDLVTGGVTVQLPFVVRLHTTVADPFRTTPSTPRTAAYDGIRHWLVVEWPVSFAVAKDCMNCIPPLLRLYW